MYELTTEATFFWSSIRELRSFMIGSMYLEGPTTPIIGAAASNLLLAQCVGRNLARGLDVARDTFEKFPNNPCSF